MLAEVADSHDVNFDALHENARRVEQFRTPDDRPFNSVHLPLPDPIYADGERLAASYMNYLVLNGAVLVPTYAQPQHDAQALEIIGEC